MNPEGSKSGSRGLSPEPKALSLSNGPVEGRYPRNAPKFDPTPEGSQSPCLPNHAALGHS
jgi:hypothetical protein